MTSTHPNPARLRACVDIGGTKVAVTLADANGLLQATHVAEPTAIRGEPDAVAQQIIGLIGRSCAAHGTAIDQIGAIGVSSCGPFVIEDGLIALAAPNLCGGLAGPQRGLPNDWLSAGLEAPLRQRFPGLPLRVANDAIAGLEAERRWGALQNLPHCAYVTWSTGIGIGLCVDGHVLRGKNGNAGHAGHMFVNNSDDAALCGCGNTGDVEGLVAGNALARRFAPQGFADASALLNAAQAGDASAVTLMEGVCQVMGRMLHSLVVTLDLQTISLGGSVFWHHRDWLLPRLRAQMSSYPTPLTDGFTLVPAGLGAQVGDYAALALVA